MKYAFFILVACLSANLYAYCPELYPHNTKIVVENTRELCNDMYVSVYNDEARKVIFVSELIQPTGHVVQRKDSFHPDTRVTNPVLPYDYIGTGWDRGHLAAADDSTSAVQMYQSFLMTNMTPQHPSLNRGRWRVLEETIRGDVSKHGRPIHVITGAIYQSNNEMNSIPIPTGYFKVAYYPSGTKAFFTSNVRSAQMKTVSVDWINSVSGIQLPQY